MAVTPYAWPRLGIERSLGPRCFLSEMTLGSGTLGDTLLVRTSRATTAPARADGDAESADEGEAVVVVVLEEGVLVVEVLLVEVEVEVEVVVVVVVGVRGGDVSVGDTHTRLGECCGLRESGAGRFCNIEARRSAP